MFVSLMLLFVRVESLRVESSQSRKIQKIVQPRVIYYLKTKKDEADNLLLTLNSSHR